MPFLTESAHKIFETTDHYVAQVSFELTVPLPVLELLVILLLWFPESWAQGLHLCAC